MPTATFSKFNAFVADVANGKHNLGSNTLTIALSNTAPNGTTGAVLADITQISYTNLPTSRNVTIATSAQSGGLYKLLSSTALVLTASGGTVGPFRYVVLYNSSNTTAGSPLIAWWDYQSTVTMNAADTFTIQFDATNGILQLGA